MDRNGIVRRISDEKMIAIARGLSLGEILPLAEALYRGGVSVMEVTFDQARPETHPATAAAIKELCIKTAGKMMIGAGTVVSEELVRLAADSGARFIVSPDVNTKVIELTCELGMASLPGAFTPTEILTAHLSGADFVKVFPAAVLGPAYVKAIRGPLNHVRLLAVGGVDESNAASFLQVGCVGVGVGGSLCSRELAVSGQFDKITALASALCKSCGNAPRVK